MPKIVISICVVLVTVLMFLGWKLQPWMQGGRAVFLRGEDVSGYEFQVWQRKNTEITKPFATGIFVRRPGEKWKVFLLDFEDTYRPRIKIQKEGRGFAVLRSGKRLGIVDETSWTFLPDGNGQPDAAVTIEGEPPGKWWR
jgi:hypothetical protein